MLAGIEIGVQTQLHHRHVGIGKQMTKHAPCAVIQAPIFIGGYRIFTQERADFSSDFGAARRGIVHVEQRLRKTAEIVDGARFGHRGNSAAVREPMRGNSEDGADAAAVMRAQVLAERFPSAGIGVGFDGIHRAAVAEEEGGEFHDGFRMYVKRMRLV